MVVNTEKKDVRFTLELVPQSGDATLREWLHTDIPAQTALVFRW